MFDKAKWRSIVAELRDTVHAAVPDQEAHQRIFDVFLFPTPKECAECHQLLQYKKNWLEIVICTMIGNGIVSVVPEDDPVLSEVARSVEALVHHDPRLFVQYIIRLDLVYEIAIKQPVKYPAIYRVLMEEEELDTLPESLQYELSGCVERKRFLLAMRSALSKRRLQ